MRYGPDSDCQEDESLLNVLDRAFQEREKQNKQFKQVLKSTDDNPMHIESNDTFARVSSLPGEIKDQPKESQDFVQNFVKSLKV